MSTHTATPEEKKAFTILHAQRQREEVRIEELGRVMRWVRLTRTHGMQHADGALAQDSFGHAIEESLTRLDNLAREGGGT